MGEIIKFVYSRIIFLSLFLFATDTEGEPIFHPFKICFSNLYITFYLLFINIHIFFTWQHLLNVILTPIVSKICVFFLLLWGVLETNVTVFKCFRLRRSGSEEWGLALEKDLRKISSTRIFHDLSISS
jgi:hypothetical protein